MKIIVLIALLGMFTLNIKGQDIPKATYKITSSEGYSNTLNLPDTFYISVMEFVVKRDAANGFYFQTFSKTYIEEWTDSLNVKNVLRFENDSIPYRINFPISNPNLLLFTLPQIFNKTIEKLIEDEFGIANVTKLQ